MKVESNQFVALADVAISAGKVPQSVYKGTKTAYDRRLRAMFSAGVEYGEMLRQQAAEARRRSLRKLPELLELAEQRLRENGIHVLWADDATQARDVIVKIAQGHQVKLVAKSKSMVTEEIGLNDALIAAGIKAVETDLGEYILQINNEHPSHIVTPVIHKSKDEIKQVLRDKLGMPDINEAPRMVAYVREKLRSVFMEADLGISGANFVIAETGTLCLVSNEGNARLATSLPRVHIAVIGIEKVIENLDDYVLLTQLLPRSGTGQNLTVYTSMINGPCDDGGPEHVYVVFVDNGRSRIYSDPKYVEALACIRCGACLNACPVYRSTGGHAYGWVYGGPIGAVLTPLMVGLKNAAPLPSASSLCGSCKQVCPVDIDLPRMLLDLRHDLVSERHTELKWDLAIKGWEQVNRSPKLFEAGAKLARLATDWGADRLVPNPLGEWKKLRDFPPFAPKTFRQMWREREQNYGGASQSRRNLDDRSASAGKYRG